MAIIQGMAVFAGLISFATGFALISSAREEIARDRKNGFELLIIAIVVMAASLWFLSQAVRLRTGQGEYQPQQEIREYPDEIWQFEEFTNSYETK